MLLKLCYSILIECLHTVKPVYNELGYNEFPFITKQIVCSERIDLFIS